MDRNSTSFGAHLRQFFASVEFDPAKSPLRYVQFIVKTYMDQVTRGQIINGGRGLIINHTMGIGKTITAIELMEMLRSGPDGAKRRVICIGPKATADNLDVNVAKWSKMTGKPVLQNPDGSPAYAYLTMRANNLTDQIKREAYVPTINGRKVGEIPRSATLVSALRSTVVVIDEAHLFCNSVAHGRATAVELYRALMAAEDCYVFLLTGTLIVNSPFEAVPAINLVLGKPYLPETEDDFNSLYGTPDLQKINGSRVQNIASGLLSYAALDVDDPSFPKKLRTRVIKLRMTDEQLGKYLDAREIEAAENRASGLDERNKKIFLRSFEGDTKTSSSYRVRSRIASNGPNKIAKVCEIVAAHPDELFLVHCPFVERGGVHDVAEGLRDRLGYREMKIRDGKVIEDDGRHVLGDMQLSAGIEDPVPAPPTDEGGNPIRHYVVLSGENSDKATISQLLMIINCPANRYGAYCHVFIITAVGSAGLDLKNGRHVIYMSPSWHLEEFNQTVARYVRLNASDALPPEKRTVQPYILVSIVGDTTDPQGSNLSRNSTASDGANKGAATNDRGWAGVSPAGPSTDEYLLELGLLKLSANISFMNLLRSVSIECLAGLSPDPSLCRVCVANDMPLTYGSHRNDMRMPNSCEPAALNREALEQADPAKMERLEVHDGRHTYEIHYRRQATGNLLMYEYDPASLQYIRIGRGHPLHDAIVSAVNDNVAEK